MEKNIETARGKFTIRPYRAEDKTAAQELWELCFGNKINRNLWDWKYAHSPYGTKLLLCCGEDQKIAVMYGGIPYLANWKGHKIKIAHLVDIMAHPEYRGWLFIKTAKAFFETCTGGPEPVFLYGFPGEKHFVIGQKLLKYRKLTGGMNFLSASTSELENKACILGTKVFPIYSADHRFDRLWEKIGEFYPFSIVRNKTFINWRFYQHPQYRYEVWGYGSIISSKLRGYMVLLRDSENKVAHLIDILTDNSRKMIIDFLSRIGSILRKSGITEIKTWLPIHHFIAESAMESGFKPLKEPLGIIPVGRSFNPDLSLDWISQHIFYTMCDGDLF